MTSHLAIAKAYTALSFRQDTQALGSLSEPFHRFFDVQVLDTDLFVTGPGGIYSESDRFKGSVGVACDVDNEESLKQSHDIAAFAVNAIISNMPASLSVSSRSSLVGSAIPLKQAEDIADKIVRLAGGRQIAIAVVDSGANLKLVRTNSEVLPDAYVRAAISKAVSARSFNLDDSAGLNGASEPGSPAYGVQITNGGLFTVPGATVLYAAADSRKDSTQIIGAVGIEGVRLSESDLRNLLNSAIEEYYADKTNFLPPVTLRGRRGITSSETNAAVRKAIQIRKSLTSETTPGVYVITDVSGHVRAYYTEDGVEYGAPDIALKSSLTSAIFQKNSDDLGKLTQPGKPLYNVELTFGGLVTFETAAVLYSKEGGVIGAIGVSGTGAGKGTTNDGIIAKGVSEFIRSFEDECASRFTACHRVVEPVIDIDLSLKDTYDGISLAQAVGLIRSVENFTVSTSQAACITVLNYASRPKARFCQDDAFVGATDLSPRKARSGQAFGKDNQNLQAVQVPGGILYKVEVTNGGLFFNAGGSPLKNAVGRTVGGVGVAGAADDAQAVSPAVKLWNSILY